MSSVVNLLWFGSLYVDKKCPALSSTGHPLRDCLQVFVEKKIPSARYFMVILDFAAQGFEALSYIHRNRIGHLDIKRMLICM